MKKKVYKAAIVGCGRIASLFAADKKRKGIVTHAQAYQAHPRTRLISACDLNRERLEDFGRRWNVDRLYTDFEEMMKTEKPDIVSICTFNSSHAEIAGQAAKHGVSGIICEKPIADSLASAERMIKICRDKNIPLLVNYSRRYDALHQQFKTWIEKGHLGKVQTVSCYYTAGIMNTGTHLFDILRYFFGEVRWVWANPEKVLPGKDPTADLYLFFKKGFGCNVSALDVRNYMQFEIDIYGTKSRLRIEDSGMRATRWKVENHRLYSGYKTLVPSKIFSTDFGKNLYGMVDSLVRLIERKKAPACKGEDGKKSLEIAIAAYLSLQRKQKIFLPLKDKKLVLESL